MIKSKPLKLGANNPCPCCSSKKYKKCCKPFHEGVSPLSALELMRSRYCAYALGNSVYIMDTTHKQNSDYKEDRFFWNENIKQFMQDTQFENLEIIDFIDGKEEAYVTFKATIFIKEENNTFIEKSRFVKENGKWLYISGDFS